MSGIQESPSASNEPPKRRATSYLRAVAHVTPALFLLSVLLAAWFSSLENIYHNSYRFFFALLFVIVWLILLFLVEALEIAYTILAGKYEDELGTADGNLMRELRGRHDLIYDAREWVVILGVVAITLTTEFEDIYLPWIGKIPDWHISYLPASWIIRPHVLFSLLTTTLPVIWFAQGPAKEIAEGCPQKMLVKSRVTLPFIKAVNWFVKTTRLRDPVSIVTKTLQRMQSFKPESNFLPSDEGFFTAALERYGSCMHQLSVTINIEEDGACSVLYKFVFYLLKYKKREFLRHLEFDSKVKESPLFRSIRGYKFSVGKQPYGAISTALDAVGRGESPVSLRQVADGFVWGDPTSKGHSACFYVRTKVDVPHESEIFVIAAECEADWEAGAFNLTKTESFQMTLDYPCRRYEVEILPGKTCTSQLTNIFARASFRGNAHEGETERFTEALQVENDGLRSVFNYALPGGEYKHTWDFIPKRRSNETI